jgi:hypothetical protein
MKRWYGIMDSETLPMREVPDLDLDHSNINCTQGLVIGGEVGKQVPHVHPKYENTSDT